MPDAARPPEFINWSMTTRPVDLSADPAIPGTVPGPPLTVQTLGVPRVWVAGAACPLSGKSLALLVYLALEGPVHRDLLTELLWTEKAGQGARGNLRQELYRLRGKLPGGWLRLEGDWAEVRGAQVDALQLRDHLAAGPLGGRRRTGGRRISDGPDAARRRGFRRVARSAGGAVARREPAGAGRLGRRTRAPGRVPGGAGGASARLRPRRLQRNAPAGRHPAAAGAG